MERKSQIRATLPKVENTHLLALDAIINAILSPELKYEKESKSDQDHNKSDKLVKQSIANERMSLNISSSPGDISFLPKIATLSFPPSDGVTMIDGSTSTSSHIQNPVALNKHCSNPPLHCPTPDESKPSFAKKRATFIENDLPSWNERGRSPCSPPNGGDYTTEFMLTKYNSIALISPTVMPLHQPGLQQSTCNPDSCFNESKSSFAKNGATFIENYLPLWNERSMSPSPPPDNKPCSNPPLHCPTPLLSPIFPPSPSYLPYSRTVPDFCSPPDPFLRGTALVSSTLMPLQQPELQPLTCNPESCFNESEPSFAKNGATFIENYLPSWNERGMSPSPPPDGGDSNTEFMLTKYNSIALISRTVMPLHQPGLQPPTCNPDSCFNESKSSFSKNGATFIESYLPSWNERGMSPSPSPAEGDSSTEYMSTKDNSIVISSTGSSIASSSEEWFQCEHCSKKYATFYGMTRHRLFHCVYFNCKFCEKKYTSFRALKMHMNTHLLPCKCNICGKVLSKPWLLQGHIRTHTGEKPFECNHCSRAFADRSNLRAHLKTHLDTKKHSCYACSKTFSRMSFLIKHIDGGCCIASTTQPV